MNSGSNLARKRGGGRPATPLRVRLRTAAREAILERAEEVFCERGLQAARVEEIAARAGVSVGTLYNYFGDRQGLVAALLESGREQLFLTVDDSVRRSAGKPFAERLRALLDATVAHFAVHQRLFALFSEDELVDMRLAQHRHRCAFKDMLTRVEQLAREGIAAGELREEHADLYPVLVTGTLRNLFVRQVLTQKGRPLEVTGAELVDLFMNGARKR
jgi:AcrR family transcriptional regulator